MKIAAVSDLHGHLPPLPKADVLVIAGDLGPARKEYHQDLDYAREWLEGPFSNWLDTFDGEIVGIAGNHDIVAQQWPMIMTELPWTYLCSSGCEIGGVSFWGSPWTPRFYDWAFMAPDDMLTSEWFKSPDSVDVLITHGPPQGRGDKNEQGEHCGSNSLSYRIGEMESQPQLHVFGHIHEGRGIRGLNWANVSYVDESYRPEGPIQVFDVEPH